jgi:hypothetical protein
MRRKLIFLGIVLCFLLVTIVNGADITTGLRAYWNWDNVYTNYTGGATYTPTTTTGGFNSSTKQLGTHSLYFLRGSTTYNNVTWGDQKFGVTGNLYSISFWVYNIHNTTIEFFISKEKSSLSGEFQVRTSGSGDNLVWQNYADSGATVLSITSSGVNISNSAWHFIQLVQNRTIAYMYIDNVQRGIDTTSDFSSWNGTSKFYVGRRDAQNFQGCAGCGIDDLAIFKYALTSANRTYMYNSGTGRTVITASAGDSCTYSGTGNWIVTNNCNITTTVKVQSGYALIMKGTGKTLKISGSGLIR